MEQINEGETIVVQGTPQKDIIILQQGNAELLMASNEYIGLGENIIISRSKRILSIKEPGIILGLGSMQGVQPNKRTLKAITACQIVRYPLSAAGFEGIIMSAPEDAASILKQMVGRISSAVQTDEKYSKLYQSVCTMCDDLALIYKELGGTGAPQNLDEKADIFYKSFTRQKAPFPEFFSGKFLLTDNSRFISRRYTLTGESVEEILKKSVVTLIRRILNTDKTIVSDVLTADKSIGTFICTTLADLYENVLFRMENASDMVEGELDTLLQKEGSWADYLVNLDGFDQWKNTGRLAADFIKNMLSIIVKLNELYTDLKNEKLTAVYPGVKLIHEFYTNAGKPERQQTAPSEGKQASAEVNAAVQGASVPITDLKNSINTIFSFAGTDKSVQSKFLKLLNDFKNSSSPLSTDSDSRRLRSLITTMFWDLYKQAFIRSKSEPRVPKPVRLMLSYGFLDETLLENEQLAELNRMVAVREPKPSLAILKETEFLSLIRDGRETPSITEMGLSYEAFLREESKSKSSKKSDEPEQQISEENQKVMYEIDHRLAETAAVCSGARSTAFPILCSAVVKGSLESMLCTKARVEKAARAIMDIDFSLFYRETVLKITEEDREIIQEEVTPYFILLPVFGTRTLLWQELSGTNKRSRSRIVIPIFFMGDLEKSLAHTLACFRWELNRSIKGAMWADPIEGGLTGEYFDYVNTFKKNAKLSTEAKDKLAERFKALRTNRDRFADDYLMWIFYEKDGIMKLNNVVREMFYKHIPFNKRIREQLFNMPAFAHAANRYKNVQTRTAQAYERKFKKYKDEATGHYPPEIEKFMHFLQS